mgnify:CR=1 FL=1
MPHQFQAINCKKCDNHYCPVCERTCTKCGEYDIADDNTMVIRSNMRLHMNKNKKIKEILRKE